MKQIDLTRKRLYYQSQHRGIKEMDLILGGFAQQHLPDMSHEELRQFEDLLAFPDQDLYGWFFEGTSLPESISHILIEKIGNHIKRP